MTTSNSQRLTDLEAEAFRTGRSPAALHEEIRGVAADTELLPALSGKIAAIEQDVAALRADLADNLGGLRRDNAVLQEEIRSMRSEMRAWFTGVSGVLERLPGAGTGAGSES